MLKRRVICFILILSSMIFWLLLAKCTMLFWVLLTNDFGEVPLTFALACNLVIGLLISFGAEYFLLDITKLTSTAPKLKDVFIGIILAPFWILIRIPVIKVIKKIHGLNVFE